MNMRIAAALFILGVSYLAYTGLSTGTAYYVSVAEALTLPAEQLHAAYVFGTVKPEGLFTSPDNKVVSFFLEDTDSGAKNIRVTYRGLIPDTFKAGIEVVVEGQLDRSSNSFAATSLITKCPSKYQKENRT